MCLICLDFKRGALSLNEARRNLTEFSHTGAIPEEHIEEVGDMLREREEDSLSVTDPEPFDPFWYPFWD